MSTEETRGRWLCAAGDLALRALFAMTAAVVALGLAHLALIVF